MPGPFDLVYRQAWATTFFFRHWAGHAEHVAPLTQHLISLRDRQSQPIASGIALTAKSSYGLFESPFDLLSDPHPSLSHLRAFIVETVRMAVAHVNGLGQASQQIQVDLLDSWFHITNAGGFHDAHFHSSCSWCGIYYVQAGDSSLSNNEAAGNGVNRFYSPIPTGGLLADLGNAYLSQNRVDIAPNDGMLMLFPAYLLHSALAYRGTRDRIIISFNSRSRLITQPAVHPPRSAPISSSAAQSS